MKLITFRSIAGAAVLALTGFATPDAGSAQRGPLALNAEFSGGHAEDVMKLSKSLARGGYAVVIDLDENELSFRQGRTVLWTAPIGTGTGLRLETDDMEWDFSTPDGVFHVQYKEENPVWIAPDWYFIENDLPVPPQDDERRRFPGGLGAAAVYIGHDLAIHGTDKPELLGQRVSHGCIRLSDRDALRLYHNVQIGTEVVIVGGERVQAQLEEATVGNDPSTFDPAKPKPKPRDALLERWKSLETEELGLALRDELWMPDESTRWSEVAGLLLRRGLAGDDAALASLMLGLGDLPNGRLEKEYRTVLADAFSRRTHRSLKILSELPRNDRDRAAEAIVAALMGLYGGELDSASAPWPTRRIPSGSVEPEGRLGWNSLERAERSYRELGTTSRV